MDFKPTSIDRAARGRSGIGIVEFMVAMAVGALLVLAVLMVFSFSTRSFRALGNYSDLDQQSRYSLDTMTKEIRSTRYLYSYNTNFAIFKDYNTNWLYYWWDSYAKRVYRWQSGQNTRVMLERCDMLRFDFYQRNPIGGQFNYYPPSTGNYTNTCKLVQLSWVCSSNVLGTTKNSENVQSAKVVIRNQ